MIQVKIITDGKETTYWAQETEGIIFAKRKLMIIDGRYFNLLDEPPIIYQDENGNDVRDGQEIWFVQVKDILDNDVLWQPQKGHANGALAEKENLRFKVFTTKEAAERFVEENKPFELLTADGVKVGENAIVQYVNKSTFESKTANVQKYFAKDDNHLFFSTREAANEYIKKHKGVLSLDMVLKDIAAKTNEPEDYVVKYNPTYWYLKELVNEQFKK